MGWTVSLHDEFDPEVDALPKEARKALISMMELLEIYGPRLGRPHADTLAGSRHANMKELRFTAARGGLPLRSIRRAKPSCLSQPTRAGWRGSGFMQA